jgi:PKD repeat protein
MRKFVGIFVMAILVLFSACKKDNIKPEVDNKPVISFDLSKSTAGLDDTIQITSSVLKNGPCNFEWKFVGGNPATSLSANPKVSYDTPGTYKISVCAYNNISGKNIFSDTVSKTITVIDDRLEISGQIKNVGSMLTLTKIELRVTINGLPELIGSTMAFGADHSYKVMVKRKYLGKTVIIRANLSWTNPANPSSSGCGITGTSVTLAEKNLLDWTIPSSFQ